jgi:hypothetical protein
MKEYYKTRAGHATCRASRQRFRKLDRPKGEWGQCGRLSVGWGADGAPASIFSEGFPLCGAPAREVCLNPASPATNPAGFNRAGASPGWRD